VGGPRGPGAGTEECAPAGTDTISGAVTDVDETPGTAGAAGTETPPLKPPAGPGIVLTPSLGGGGDETTKASANTGMLSWIRPTSRTIPSK
jgi:hypothetical protein